MTCKLFTVYDQKAEIYGPISTYRTTGECLRQVKEAVNNPEHAFAKHPADYNLFELGEWDDSSATVKMYPAPINLGCALEFINPNSEKVVQPPQLNERMM